MLQYLLNGCIELQLERTYSILKTYPEFITYTTPGQGTIYKTLYFCVGLHTETLARCYFPTINLKGKKTLPSYLQFVHESVLLARRPPHSFLQVTDLIDVVVFHPVVLPLLGGQQLTQRRLLSVQTLASVVQERHLKYTHPPSCMFLKVYTSTVTCVAYVYDVYIVAVTAFMAMLSRSHEPCITV